MTYADYTCSQVTFDEAGEGDGCDRCGCPDEEVPLALSLCRIALTIICRQELLPAFDWGSQKFVFHFLLLASYLHFFIFYLSCTRFPKISCSCAALLSGTTTGSPASGHSPGFSIPRIPT
jgi:hypothetical protein